MDYFNLSVASLWRRCPVPLEMKVRPSTMADLDPVEYGQSLLVCSVILIMFWILFRTGFQVARRCWVSSRVFKLLGSSSIFSFWIFSLSYVRSWLWYCCYRNRLCETLLSHVAPLQMFVLLFVCVLMFLLLLVGPVLIWWRSQHEFSKTHWFNRWIFFFALGEILLISGERLFLFHSCICSILSVVPVTRDR